jgi:hypothetical protein
MLHRAASTIEDAAVGATPHKSPGSPAKQKAEMKAAAEAAAGPQRRPMPNDRKLYQEILTQDGEEHHDAKVIDNPRAAVPGPRSPGRSVGPPRGGGRKDPSVPTLPKYPGPGKGAPPPMSPGAPPPRTGGPAPIGSRHTDGQGGDMLTGSQTSYSNQDAHKKAKYKKVKGK